MNTPTHELLAQAVQATAHILTRRLILLVGLFLDFWLFVWTAYSPDPWRLGSAVLFGGLVWLSVSFPRQ